MCVRACVCVARMTVGEPGVCLTQLGGRVDVIVEHMRLEAAAGLVSCGPPASGERAPCTDAQQHAPRAFPLSCRHGFPEASVV